MFKITWIFLLLILASLIGLYLQQDPGYVLIMHKQLSIEMTLSVAILCFICVFFILHMILILYYKLKHIPTYLYNLNQKIKAKKSMQEELEQITQTTYLNKIKYQILQNPQITCVELLDLLPRKIKYNPEIIATIATYLIKNKNYVEAEEIIRKSLNNKLDANLIYLYSFIPVNPAKLQYVETLIDSNPNNQHLYLCLSRLNFSAHLWGQAKLYLSKSLEISPSPQAYILLAQLLEQTNDLVGACEAYQKCANIFIPEFF